jgi:hypothetical protein
MLVGCCEDGAATVISYVCISRLGVSFEQVSLRRKLWMLTYRA